MDRHIRVLSDSIDESVSSSDIESLTSEENADHLYSSLLSRGWALVHIETMASLFRVSPAPPAIAGIVYEAMGEQARRYIGYERERIADSLGGLEWQGCGGYGCSDNMADLLGDVLAIVRDGVSPEWSDYARESVNP
jgi:hypothetical protein